MIGYAGRSDRSSCGQSSLIAIRADDLGLDPEQLVHLRALLRDDHPAVGVREGQVPVLREHEVEVELLREALVQRHALAVELGALGGAVVRADDRRVPAGCPGADVRLLEDADVLDPVVLREVVRGREPVRAAADDHHVVAALELAARPPHPASPGRCPSRALLQAFERRRARRVPCRVRAPAGRRRGSARPRRGARGR